MAVGKKRRRKNGFQPGAAHPFYGRPLPDEMRRKISEGLRGHKVSEQTRLKLTRPNAGQFKPGVEHRNYGKRRSFETRARISAAKIGHSVTAETRRKISEKHKGKVWSCDAIFRLKQTLTGRKQTHLHNLRIAVANWGSKSHFAKLTEEQAQAIVDSGDGIQILMKRYRVSRATISRIKSGKTWPHLRRGQHG